MTSPKTAAKTLTGLPAELEDSLRAEFSNVANHSILGEWDDLEVDAGRFSEAVLRYLELKMKGKYTPVDGRSKPNRKAVTNAARQDKTLPASLRFQVPGIIELILDFRNNRNSAHLGIINPGKIDGTTVAQLSSWVMGEIIRLESGLQDKKIQLVLDELAERPAALVYEVEGQPIVLSTKLTAKETVLVLLWSRNDSPTTSELFKWSGHSHVTRWKKDVLGSLVKKKQVFIKGQKVHILPPGSRVAEKIIQREDII